MPEERKIPAAMAEFFAKMQAVKAQYGAEMHKAVTLYEDLPCYPVDKVLQLFELEQQLMRVSEAERETVGQAYVSLLNSIQPKADAPTPIYLWPDGKIPALTVYTDNSDYMQNHNPDFRPHMFEILVPADVTPKGAVIVCAGGNHGSSCIHEGYQVSLDMAAMGYQAFLLLNRPNNGPWNGQECGADSARAIRYVRAHAAEYRIDPNNVAFAGFSNGGLTGEACIRYFSGKQTVADHFPDYTPDELDAFYGAPDAFLCVYGPRFNGADFDYRDVVYPPTFFAVGRGDTAMNNLHWMYPSLLEHGVPVEVHTFAGVPHGEAGSKIRHGGISQYPSFDLWEPLADAFMQDVYHPAPAPSMFG